MTVTKKGLKQNFNKAIFSFIIPKLLPGRLHVDNSSAKYQR